MARCLGVMLYYLLARDRCIALCNVRRVYGDCWSTSERQRFIRRVFMHVSCNAIDALRLPRYSPATLSRIVRTDGWDHIPRAYQKGCGVIGVTAHVGCWELIPNYIAAQGYQVSVVARQVYDPQVNRIVLNIRESMGVQVLDRHASLREIVRCLRRGEGIGILIDQDTSVESVIVDFLGQKTRTPVGPALLSLLTGAPVLPMAIHREQDGQHVMEIDAPVTIEATGDREADVLRGTAELSKRIERFIQRYPDQWLWMQQRWKSMDPVATDHP